MDPRLDAFEGDSGPSRWGVAISLLVFIFILFATTLRNPFFFDDSHTILGNSAIQAPSNLLRLWTSASYYSVTPDNWGYRPVTTFANSAAWLIGQGAVWPFHLEKILAHFGICFLLYLIWERLWRLPGFFPARPPKLRFALGSDPDFTWELTPGAAAAAMAFVFAAHPANSEILNYISASSTLFTGFWYLLAYYGYLRFRENPRWLLLAASCLAYLLSVLAKEEGITLIGVVALTELMLPRTEARRKSGFAIACLACTAAAAAALLHLMFAPTSDLARGWISRWPYFMTQWRAYLRYMAMLVWPWDFNADNLEFGFSFSFWDVRVLSALCANLLILGAAWMQRRRYPVLLFGVLWFYIAISPASSIIPLSEPVNDHRMTLAYFGLIGAVFPWILKWIEEACGKIGSEELSPASGAVALLLLVALGVGTEIRNRVWSSQESLWGDTVAKNPSSGRALNNLAIVYMERAEWTKTRELLDRCEQVAPTYAVCKINQAIAQAALGHDSEAEKKFQEGIALEPYNTVDKLFYGEFLLKRGFFERAITVFKDIDRFSRGANLRAKLDWAMAEKDIGNIAEARSILTEAERRFPGDREIAGAIAETKR